jgi:hypothetical protein
MRCYFSPDDLSPVGQVLGRQLDLLLYLYLLAMALFLQVILLVEVEVILLHLLLRMMTILLLLVIRYALHDLVVSHDVLERPIPYHGLNYE